MCPQPNPSMMMRVNHTATQKYFPLRVSTIDPYKALNICWSPTRSSGLRASNLSHKMMIVKKARELYCTKALIASQGHLKPNLLFKPKKLQHWQKLKYWSETSPLLLSIPTKVITPKRVTNLTLTGCVIVDLLRHVRRGIAWNESSLPEATNHRRKDGNTLR